MASRFNTYIEQVYRMIEESKRPKCTGPGLPELSSKRGYKFSRCVENPYSDGYKRIFYGKVGKKTNIAKCLKNMPQAGTGKYEDCKLAIRAWKRRLALKRAKKA